jgi:hypothetical protein
LQRPAKCPAFAVFMLLQWLGGHRLQPKPLFQPLWD